ncbi:MAG: type I-E CRISPR-associated protein Cas6/Cse3/CasE [Gemmatimonadota bacterium]|nr:type I-E CRISPR-associated protein Cas6/Cse3/CasE [Gemmatimonadota bacterium]
MTTPLSLIRLHPNATAFVHWAIEKGYLPRRGDADLGYALHAALKEALGDFAPRPFVFQQPREGEGTILGYVQAKPDAITEAAGLPSIRASADALGLQTIEAHAMPKNWRTNARFSFEVRTRPIVRSRDTGRNGPNHEVDVAAWAARRAEERSESLPSKEDAYREWLAARLDFYGVRLIAAQLVSMRRTRVLRRPIIGGHRRVQEIEGPDVLFRGNLEVTNGERFAEGITCGIGRHTAFGFGCLLLAPAGTWG